MISTLQHSASHAMAWWYLRRTWRLAVLVALGMAAGPWLFARMVGLPMDLSATGNVAYCLQYSVLALIGLGTCVWMPLDELDRLHRPLPVSSRQLAGMLLLAPAMAMLLLNVMSLMIFHWLFSVPWPVFSLSVSIAVLTLQLSAAYYSLHRFSWWKLAIWLSFVGAYLAWTAWHFFPSGFRQPIALWQSSVWDAVVWAAAATVALRWGRAGYANVRCQNNRASALLQLLKRQPRELLAGSPKIRPLTDSRHSLRGVIDSSFLPTGLASGAAMSLLFAAYAGFGVVSARGGESFGELSTMLPVTFITTCGCMGLLLGAWTGTEHWGYPGKAPPQVQFLMSLPFSTRDLGKAITRCLATSLGLGVLTMCAVVSVAGLIAYAANLLPSHWVTQSAASSTIAMEAVYIASQSLVVAWLAASLAYGLTALRRPAWVAIAFSIAYGSLFLLALLQHQAPGWRPFAMFAVAAVVAVAAVWLVAFAAKRTLVSNASLAASAIAAVVLGVISWMLPYPAPARVLCVAVALLALATPSLIATSLVLNRHG